MAFRKRPGDRKDLDPEPKPRGGGGVLTYSAKELRDKRRNDPQRERLAKALERGMCE